MAVRKSATAERRPPSQRQHAPESAAVDSTLNEITALVASLDDLHQQIALAYAPIVQGIIQSGSHDVQEIEHALDRLLTCAGHPEGLLLFKALCRYYYGIDPAAAAQHVYFYREWFEDQASDESAIALSSRVTESAKLGQAIRENLRGLGHGS